MSWRRKGENQFPFTEVADLHRQSACLPEPLKDGETYRLWVRATDIVGHSKVGLMLWGLMSSDVTRLA